MPKDNPTAPRTATACLVAALAHLDNVKANKINPAFKARYVTLDSLLDAVKPVLFDHDLALIQTLVSADEKIGVSTAFLHTSGERFEFGTILVKSEGRNDQQIGAHITYIRKQSIQTACGISVDLDDDGSSASRPAPGRVAGPWWSFLTAVEAEHAHEYLTKKGWLPATAQSLDDLAPDKVEIIIGNKPAFMKAIK